MAKKKATKVIEEAQETPDFSIEKDMLFLQMGVDFDSRKIHVDMAVDDTMASIILRGLIRMNSQSSEPIDLYLASYGGDVYAAMSIFDAIRASKAPVRIHGNGKLMSAGFMIFLAADQRDASPNTTFMFHSISYGSEGKVRDQEVSVTEAKRLNNIFLDILQQRTKQTKKYWYRKINGADFFLDVAQAKECGVIPVPKATKKVTKKKVVRKGK